LRVPPIRLCRAFAESDRCRFHLEQPWIANVLKSPSFLTEGRHQPGFCSIGCQTKGMSVVWAWWVVPVGFCARTFCDDPLQHHRVNYQTEAWSALQKERLPSSLETVADKYPDVERWPN